MKMLTNCLKACKNYIKTKNSGLWQTKNKIPQKVFSSIFKLVKCIQPHFWSQRGGSGAKVFK
jgi:hypothetical protein